MNNKLLTRDYIILVIFKVMIMASVTIVTFGFPKSDEIISVYTPYKNSLDILKEIPASQLVDYNPQINMTTIKLSNEKDFSYLKQSNYFLFKAFGGSTCQQ